MALTQIEVLVAQNTSESKDESSSTQTPISLETGDDQDSKSWDPTKLSWPRKLHIICAGFTCTFNGNLGSSMPSGALDAISDHFNVTNELHLTLLNSLYMVGYVLGPLVFGPLSEYVGRRPVLVGTFLGYLTFMLACSGAPTYTALVIFRLLCGINAAAPTTVISGLYSDILDDPSHRGSAIALYMTVTSIGPLVGPIISSFSSQKSWRWPFWAAGLIAVPGLPLVLSLPETFAPVLHNRWAKRQQWKRRDETVIQLHPFNVRKIFLRPFTLMFTQPIVLFTSLYLTLVYSLFYLMFQAYPIIFQRMTYPPLLTKHVVVQQLSDVFAEFYGLAPGPAGLMYLPMAGGVILSLFLFQLYDRWHLKALAAGKEWAQREIYRRLPLACFASPCMVISLFWLGWTPSHNIPPIVPALHGIFFGAGFQMVFMGMVNYLTDAFRDQSASANAAASTTRSIGAVVFPLAAHHMYSNLGIHWAPSLLGFVALAMGAIPFLFIKYGDRLVR
ncbi:Sugar (and other) transporter [Geosmithia morbida]|uniref:Sugar (And other) transporter n=1 Tax=Geosmithia morbida TaxID=1094350 RepID=A0A9P4YQA2_9HYPO|nr:Sugar (and other) transporter [Geosmithia morbida]KAF4119814.1 Sugar (and other) transporter [Geosmithia morbida]